MRAWTHSELTAERGCIWHRRMSRIYIIMTPIAWLSFLHTARAPALSLKYGYLEEPGNTRTQGGNEGMYEVRRISTGRLQPVHVTLLEGCIRRYFKFILLTVASSSVLTLSISSFRSAWLVLSKVFFVYLLHA